MKKFSFEELERMLTEAKEVVPQGSRWRHYKGNDYMVERLVFLEQDARVAVVYTPIAHPDVSFVRPLSIWLERVAWHDDVVPRFTLVG